MKENILRILLSLFIVFTFFEVFRNSSSDYFVKIADGLSQFSLKSDLPADEVSRLVMSEADSAGFDILIEDYEMINGEGYTVFYKTNNTDDLISIETSKGSIRLDQDESFSNCIYGNSDKQYRLFTTSDFKIIFLPFEEFCKREKNVYDFILCCKNSDKDIVFASFKQLGFEVTGYADITAGAGMNSPIQIVSGLVYLLAVLLCTSLNAKKSTLMRMDGFSIVNISAREIAGLLPCGVIVFLISFMFSALYVGLIVKISVVKYFISGLGLFKFALYVFILASIIRIVFNFFFCKEKYIKGALPGNILFFLISIIKTGSVILLITSITSFVSGVLLPNIESYLSLKKYSNKIEGLVYFTQNKGDIEQCDLSEARFAPKLMDFYHDAVINYDAIVCNTYDYWLDDNGMPLYIGNAKAGFGPSVEVNNNYLKENEVYDLEGNRIYEESLEPDCLTILIPDDYQWDEQLFVRYDNIEYYPDLKVVFKEYDSQCSQLYVYLPGGIGNNQGIISPAPAIYVVNDYSLENDWHFKYNLLLNILFGRTMFRTHTDNPSAELAPLFEKYDCRDIIDGIIPLKSELNERIATGWKSALASRRILSALIIFTVVTSVLTSDFYCRNRRYLIAARALSGYSFIRTFRAHVLVLCLEYIAAFIAAAIMAFNTSKAWVPLTITLIIVVSDLITNILRCRQQLKKNVYQISKGEM